MTKSEGYSIEGVVCCIEYADEVVAIAFGMRAWDAILAVEMNPNRFRTFTKNKMNRLHKNEVIAKFEVADPVKIYLQVKRCSFYAITYLSLLMDHYCSGSRSISSSCCLSHRDATKPVELDHQSCKRTPAPGLVRWMLSISKARIPSRLTREIFRGRFDKETFIGPKQVKKGLFRFTKASLR